MTCPEYSSDRVWSLMGQCECGCTARARAKAGEGVTIFGNDPGLTVAYPGGGGMRAMTPLSAYPTQRRPCRYTRGVSDIPHIYLYDAN